jgi:formylglycine-generating enzyme required for sulfatase activity/predicted Ser/Thr protein kinase
MTNRALGELLVRRGLLTTGQVEALLLRTHEGSLKAALVQAGHLRPDQLQQILGESAYDPDATGLSQAPPTHVADETFAGQIPGRPLRATYDSEATALGDEGASPQGREPYDPDSTSFSKPPEKPTAPLKPLPSGYDPDATTLSQATAYPEPQQTAPYDADATALSRDADALRPALGPAPAATRVGPGERFGPFLIESTLGEGGMGAVYRARDVVTGRPIALKVIKNVQFSGEQRERFLREGQLTAALTHPNVVRVHGAGEVGGVPYLAYELIEGVGLKEAMKGISREGQLDLIAQVADGLGFAHARGITHRDVKPDNALVDREGRVHVADFGLAFADEGDRLTKTGTAMGTPAYMAPEQVDGLRELQGPPTDVWALGVLLYEALTGKRPFRGASLANQYGAILFADPLLPRELDATISPELEAVTLKALAKAPAERYPDANAFAADLRLALGGGAVSAESQSLLLTKLRRWRHRLALGIALACLGAVGLWFATSPGDETPPRLEVTTPLSAGEVTGESLVIRGHVLDASWVEIWSEGTERLRVEGGQEFQLEIPLAFGPNAFAIHCADAAGNVGETLRGSATSLAGLPDWLIELESAKRPALPLPEGLEALPQTGEYRWQRDGSILVYVPPGAYPLGGLQGRSSFSETRNLKSQDFPSARVLTLSRGFFVGKFEVNWSQYEAFLEWHETKDPRGIARRKGRGAYKRYAFSPTIKDGRPGAKPFVPPDDHPAVVLSWAEALAYCERVGLRLLTDGEWEVAARGPTGLRYPWGDLDPSRETTNRRGHKSKDGVPFTHSPGRFRDVSAFGCVDMGSNVSEWVSDRFAPLPDVLPSDYSGPDAPSPNALRCIRGGAWTHTDPFRFLTSVRTGIAPTKRLNRIGFRVALSAGPPSTAPPPR